MSQYPQFIDNNRKNLAEVIREIAPSYKTLSIATGYWDLAGTLEIIDQLDEYKSIRLLIGQEPLAHRLQEKYNIDMNKPENIFPDADMKRDLEQDGQSDEINELRRTTKKLIDLIESGKVEVKIYREPRLHAKAYIFGDLGEGDSVGIIGSSNFTKAGLTRNSELNFLTDDYKIVEFEPKTNNQENGHLTWFNDLWSDEEAIEWTGAFTEILKNSPVGNYTYGSYDVYIRTLMAVFPDELIDTTPFTQDVQNILHPFQNQNAMSLMRKLKHMGVAMLSDSVGLGKTITAAAIVKQFIEEGKNNIVIMPPASLKKQWEAELQSDRWNLVADRDFKVISQQDGGRIDELIEYSKERKGSKNEIDLFIIDEAHNLRNQSSARYHQCLKLFQENPDSNVLLLTATPINNSLMDFANQIQLGSKGDLVSRNVPYTSPKGEKLEYIDFFDALKRIQSEETRARKHNEKFNWNQYRNTLTAGIRYYLVRATRQGVVKRGAMKGMEGNDDASLFPDSTVKQFKYIYEPSQMAKINSKISKSRKTVFEGFNPERLNLELAGKLTQRTEHPLDLFKKIRSAQKNGNATFLENRFSLSGESNSPIMLTELKTQTIIPAIFKIINFLGFAPYKPDTYQRTIYGKTLTEIRQLGLKGKKQMNISLQLSIHNMLHVTWLKRLESSTATLYKSIENYSKRMAMFEKWLADGYILSLSDVSTLDNEYGEDIDKAFDDYDEYLKELELAITSGNEQEVKKRGIKRKIADESIYNLVKLHEDLKRDKKICIVLKQLLKQLSEDNEDKKLKKFADEIVSQIESGKYGHKVLVFSFFSDTIEYLRDNISNVLNGRIKNFDARAEFVSSNIGNVEDIAKRFSPKSKRYELKSGEKEVDFLFATDVLSEGQNLQDAGILVNYDLHWNPVRMIQRNGRINRLGSEYKQILIANARPHDDLELYLKLVSRLESKIETINNTVGNDQSILGEQANPIEYNDMIDSEGIYDEDATKATAAMNALENQGDILDWTDNYSLELRNFIDSHQHDNEIKRLKEIPLGKWNYLPKTKDGIQGNLSEVLGLYKGRGSYSVTGEKIQDIGFVKINQSGAARGPFSGIRAEYIQEQDALKVIKTVPEDNQRLLDNIKIDRQKYVDKGKTEARVQFETTKEIYEVKPAGDRALKSLVEYFGDQDLLNTIKKGIRRSNEKREFEQIVRIVNGDVKENGVPLPPVIKRFEKFVNHLNKTEILEKQLDRIEGVLYYANQE